MIFNIYSCIYKKTALNFNTMNIRLLILCLCLLSQIATASTKVKGLRVWTSPDNTKAVIDLSDQVDYKLFQLSNPPRVVIDLDNTTLTKHLKLKDNPVIKNLRKGKKGKNTLRLVLDLSSEQKARSFLLKPAKQYGHRLVIQLDKPKSKKKI